MVRTKNITGLKASTRKGKHQGGLLRFDMFLPTGGQVPRLHTCPADATRRASACVQDGAAHSVFSTAPVRRQHLAPPSRKWRRRLTRRRRPKLRVPRLPIAGTEASPSKEASPRHPGGVAATGHHEPSMPAVSHGSHPCGTPAPASAASRRSATPYGGSMAQRFRPRRPNRITLARLPTPPRRRPREHSDADPQRP